MKFTYFSTIKSGKHLMRSLFWLNNKSTCIMSQSKPIWAALSKPIGKLYKLEWYWCDKNNKLQTHNYFIDVTDKLLSSHYTEYWYPIKDHRGYNYLPYNEWVTHENFWECIDSIMERDIITNPFQLLGYVGKDIHKMLEQVKNNSPTIKPHPNIIQQLRKRKSIVAYKEDIEHLAYNIFSLVGGFSDPIKTINQVREFQDYMPIFLDKLEIPYEIFSLDSGDYAQTFELNKTLPRHSTQTLWDYAFTNDRGIDVKKQVSNYMKNYA